jgi:hypothetical protein
MRAEDLRVREELLQTGELGRGYAPRMEAVHRKNAQRLRAIIAEHGWPDTELAGPDGTLAAWFIAQHAIGEPDFQRYALTLIHDKVQRGEVPAAQELICSTGLRCTKGGLSDMALNRCHVPMGSIAAGELRIPNT